MVIRQQIAADEHEHCKRCGLPFDEDPDSPEDDPHECPPGFMVGERGYDDKGLRIDAVAERRLTKDLGSDEPLDAVRLTTQGQYEVAYVGVQDYQLRVPVDHVGAVREIMRDSIRVAPNVVVMARPIDKLPVRVHAVHADDAL